jgi:hypothetical protein
MQEGTQHGRLHQSRLLQPQLNNDRMKVQVRQGTILI